MNMEPFLTAGLKNCTWQLKQRNTTQFGLSGSNQVITKGRPYWHASFEYENMLDQDFRALTAWIARRNGQEFTFSAYRPGREAPLGYEPTATASYSVNVSGGYIDLDTNQGDGVMSAGDMVSYTDSAGRSYIGEIVSATETSANDFRCEMRPPPTTYASAGAIVSASGAFVLQPDSVSMSTPFDIKKRVSFTARQAF